VKGGAPLKAAIINRGDAFGNGLRDGVSSALILNGKPFSDASNAANTIVRTYSTTSPITPSYASVVADVVAFQPDVIYWFGLGEFAPNVLAPYEDANAAGVKPIWVSSSSGQRAEVIAAAKTRVSLRPRLRGTSAQLTTPLSQDFFNFRYKDIYKDTAQLTFGQTQAYDAVYLIAFGAQATKPTYDPIQSQAVAAGLSKLVGGTQIIDVGPASFTKGLEALRVGETVDFNGASGPLDFDPKVGEALGDYSVWCVTTDSNTGEAAYLNATGLVWHYKTGVLEGTFNCPQ
jgi:ABC-type branched-subunit amino acid transport system substrate-binding protein